MRPTDDKQVTSDVVVVGGGPGGSATAIEAARGGASVVLLEASDDVGGNAARSTGYLAFADFTLQHEAGIADSPGGFVADMVAEIERQQDRYGIIFDEELAGVYADRSASAYEFLVDLGIRFGRFIPRPRQHRTDRMIAVKDVTQFRSCFERALIGSGVEVRTSMRALQLTTEGGRVCGVIARDADGHDHRFSAARGVVLAAGGYQANTELRRRYQPEHLATTSYLGTDTDRGDGHLMGQAVGGDLVNMTMIPPLVMVASAFVERVIAVDRTGERFHDEAGPYDDRVDALLARPDRVAHYVYDERTARATAHLIEQMPEPAVHAATLAQLAEAIGCDPSSLTATVRRWNDAVAATTDEDFGRVVFPADGTGIVEPPLHAVPMSLGINFPAGGFRVTRSMQVLDVFGRRIEGLYAVGDCVGGISPTIGLGGMRIAAAVTLGQLVGRVLAGHEAEAPPPPCGAASNVSSDHLDRSMVMDVVHLGGPT